MDTSEKETILKKLKCKDISNMHGLVGKVLSQVSIYSIKAQPLGFFYSDLMMRSGQRLRVHFWMKDISLIQDSNLLIHNHSFDLTSYVYLGNFINREYLTYDPVICQNQSGRVMGAYQVTYDQNMSVLVSKFKQYCVSEGRQINIRDNQIYQIHSGEFHETNLISDIGVTIALCEYDEFNLPQAEVLAKIPFYQKNKEINYQRTLIDEEVRNRLITAFGNIIMV